MLVVQARTGLSPEWDRGFDEEFAELISSDEDLVRAEFEALVAASWTNPPPEPPVASGCCPTAPPARGKEDDEPAGPPDDLSDPQARPPP